MQNEQEKHDIIDIIGSNKLSIQNFIEKVSAFFKKYDFSTVLQFAIANGFIWMLMSIVYVKYINLQVNSAYGILYSVIYPIGHLGAFSFGLWMLLQIIRFIGKKTFKIVAISLSTLLCFFLFSDIVVYALYRFHINIPMITLFCSPAAFELVEFPLIMILMTLGIFGAIAVCEYFLLKATTKFSIPKTCISIFVVIALLFGAFNCMHAWAIFNNDQEIMLRTEALPLKYALSANRMLMKRGLKPAKRIKINAGKAINYPLKKLEFEKQEKPKNVIMVLMDSLRADMLNPDVMPKLWEFAQNNSGSRFTKHFSGGNCTKTGVFSLFYGISGNYFDQAMRSGVGAAMIDSMLELGYEVKVFSSGSLVSPPFHRTIFTNVPNLEISQIGSSKIQRDINSIKKCVEYLKNRDNKKPYFILLFLDSIHGNAVPKDFKFKFETPMREMNFLTLGNDEVTKRNAFNLMKNACYYMDTKLDDFFKTVNMAERLKNDTVLLVTSDHGNEFSESDMKNWGHNSNFARYQTQSPLLVFGLKNKAEVIDYRTSALDISATVMQDVLKCKNQIADYSMGKNLFDPAERQFIIFTSYLETGILHKDNIYALTVYGTQQTYDPDGKFISTPPPAPVLREFLNISTQYSK